ncbi:TetR/AcrR family transcriptional regulator [Actinophytocola sp.]|uniref:TetR/AcrR family transcriptional regulator n=1 Tax=Actinophytocola sp. TaxID=1872138 RepID=UPI00389A271B
MPRETLTRDQIVRATIHLLDTEGVDGLSMRQLGGRLGSAATTIYWHVKNKDELIVLAADALWAEVDLPDLTKTDWRTAATQMAGDLYAMILRHPWLMPAMSSHLLYGPGKARHDDHLLAVYETAGFTGHTAAEATKVVFTYVLGTALGTSAETAWRTRLRRSGNEEEQLRETLTRVTEIAERFPRLQALSKDWTDTDSTVEGIIARELDFGLRTILDGLQAQLQ